MQDHQYIPKPLVRHILHQGQYHSNKFHHSHKIPQHICKNHHYLSLINYSYMHLCLYSQESQIHYKSHPHLHLIGILRCNYIHLQLLLRFHLYRHSRRLQILNRCHNHLRLDHYRYQHN